MFKKNPQNMKPRRSTSFPSFICTNIDPPIGLLYAQKKLLTKTNSKNRTKNENIFGKCSKKKKVFGM